MSVLFIESSKKFFFIYIPNYVSNIDLFDFKAISIIEKN